MYHREGYICLLSRKKSITPLQKLWGFTSAEYFYHWEERNTVSKKLTNEQRQIYINNCWVEWREVAHHSEQKRAQYLPEIENHPSLQDLNLRSLGLLLLIVWEQGRALHGLGSAGVFAEFSSLWEKLLPDTKLAHTNTIVSSEIGLETADRAAKSTILIGMQNCASKFLTVSLLHLMVL